MTAPATSTRTRKPKADAVLAAAIDEARRAVEESVSDPSLVGEHLGMVIEDDRVLTHVFACTHPGYRGWTWAATLVRAARAKAPTVNEVVLLPGQDALLAPTWVPWQDRIEAGDVQPGTLLPTADNDARLEPGFTGGETAADPEPAEASQARAVVAELGLGRERVLSSIGRGETAERWLDGDSGPDNPMTKQAPGTCDTCGFFVRLQGNLGVLFGACTNLYSPSDAKVVSVEHGCGGHSDVVAEQREAELPEPVWDTIAVDEGSLFD